MYDARMNDDSARARELAGKHSYEEVECTRCSGSGVGRSEGTLGKASEEEAQCTVCDGHGFNFARRGTAMRRLRVDQILEELGP